MYLYTSYKNHKQCKKSHGNREIKTSNSIIIDIIENCSEFEI